MRKTIPMMKYLLKFVIAIGLVCAAFGQAELNCTTPDGVAGNCISLQYCDKLKPLIRKSAIDREYVKQHKCGFDGIIMKVCCEPVAVTPEPCVSERGNNGTCMPLEACTTHHYMTSNEIGNGRTGCKSLSGPHVCCELEDNSTSNRGQDKLPTIPVRRSCGSTVNPPDPLTQCCGIDTRPSNKIYGGTEVGIGAYVWLAIIEYLRPSDEFFLSTFCGGSLISGKYVLTAAHCVVGNNNKTLNTKSVRLGEHNITNPGPDCVPTDGGGNDCTDEAISIPIESTVVHPNYQTKPIFRANDIALLRLKTMAPYTDFIRPICLPTQDITTAPPPDLILYAAGWGQVSETVLRNDVKLHVDLPYVDILTCNKKYSKSGEAVMWDKQLCAGGVKGKDTCRGDSGGPLSYVQTNSHIVIGVISYGVSNCASEDFPSVYTKVYEYLDWIKDNIKP